MENFVVEFGVRNDKFRGILIHSISKNRLETFFFKFHDQPLDRHCIQIQDMIRSENVKRSKKVIVNVTDFSFEYFHPVDQTFQFKGVKLLSTHGQFIDSANIAINRQIGQMKRANTIAENKQKRIDEHNAQLSASLVARETAFQVERAKRIHEFRCAQEKKEVQK